jgi:thiol-disulfide isomerase/thioredoxin
MNPIRAFSATMALLLAMTSIAVQKDTPEQATALMAKAQALAKKENKAVYVVFHASWCGWCKKLDGAMSKPEVSSIFNKYFVTVSLDVLENPGKKNLENPGAEDYMNANGGEGKGLPFFYFADAKGKKIVDSIRPAAGEDKGGNVGCPYEAAEIAWWLTALKKAAPGMSDAEIASMKTSFEALKKADGKAGG